MPVIGSTSKSAWKTISDYRRSCICDSWRDDFCSACKKKESFAPGVKYTSKKILQYAVVLLGFGMNLKVVMETGKQSLPIIICTITVSLVIAYVLHRVLRIPARFQHWLELALPSVEVLRLQPRHLSLMQMKKKWRRRFPLSFSLISWRH